VTRQEACNPAARTRRAFLACGVNAVCAGILAACKSAAPVGPVNLPPPSDKSTLGPGDVLTIEIVGEKELPREYQVAADGTIEVPYIHTVKVAGLEAPEIARVIRQRLVEEKVLTDPSVIVQVKEYHSRRVTLLGQVAKPGTFPFTPGLTLIGAVSLAGGMTPLARTDRVSLTRTLEDGKARTVLVNADAIMQGRAPDIPLQSGDRIYVEERLF